MHVCQQCGAATAEEAARQRRAAERLKHVKKQWYLSMIVGIIVDHDSEKVTAKKALAAIKEVIENVTSSEDESAVPAGDRNTVQEDPTAPPARRRRVGQPIQVPLRSAAGAEMTAGGVGEEA